MNTDFIRALRMANQALHRGDRVAARRWALRALRLNNHHEAPWLILAALSSPRASLEYARRALEVNPDSRAARKSIEWALRRLRRNGDFYRLRAPEVVIPQHPQAYLPQRRALLPWLATAVFALTLFLAWFTAPAWAMQPEAPPARPRQGVLEKPTFTPTPTATFTPTPTPTNTPTPTPTFTPTPTATNTPTPWPTATPRPPTAIPTQRPASVTLPPGVGPNDPWVDVDLTHQRAYAYRGTTLVRSFIVSTGTWQHPTVTGTYRIYVKYRYADMAGPGYYLPDVPYVMYFYRGYGLHGTYWHNNFGTPMSHGCVNFTIADAGWLFDFTTVGTVVNIHY